MKVFLLFCFCFLITALSNAQEYLPMLDEDNTWSVEINYEFFGDDWPSETVTVQVTIDGTEEVNGITYKKIHTNSGSVSSYCLLREENGIVYKITDDNTSDEVILYDFTLKTGDVFVFSVVNNIYCSYPGFNNGLQEMEVINTSTQLIAGQDRKVIEFEDDGYGMTEIWIEGIGSNRGFDPFGVTVDITTLNKLICFTKGDDTYFFNDATECGFLNIPDALKEKILLHPNPVTRQSILQLPEEIGKPTIKIVNLKGQLIKEEKVNANYYFIHAMDYPSGLYFYQVFDNGVLIKTEKFIVK